ncbi:hypothetical protein CIRG_06656 [Coccidioides immitis RMSCC 2394]|uniref:Uncharacterized protein n=1 Tax=Coccidioides immitis RMSCC 2394 TaxID=404692 RepID=A0A0J6YH73_COCIT|nr:hypothetical protein CIRG_06656 [Coccidioides immitis RMSCC 2394]
MSHTLGLLREWLALPSFCLNVHLPTMEQTREDFSGMIALTYARMSISHRSQELEWAGNMSSAAVLLSKKDARSSNELIWERGRTTMTTGILSRSERGSLHDSRSRPNSLISSLVNSQMLGMPAVPLKLATPSTERICGHERVSPAASRKAHQVING